MTNLTATTTRPLGDMSPSGVAPTTDQPCYAYAGDGRWLPSNQSALDECAAWNRWADTINAWTAATRSIQ